MNEHCSEKNESTLAFVDRLCSIVTRLTSVADRMAANDTVKTLSTAEIEPSSQEALQVRNERLQLVEAWTALEAEQRQQALEQTNAPPRPTTVDHDAKPIPLKNSPNPLDLATQFRLLQRECDRPRN